MFDNLAEEFLIDLEEFSESMFDLENSVEEAKNILQEKMNESPINQCNFEDNIWYLHYKTTSNRRIINFDQIKELSVFNTELRDMEFLTIIKCWVSNLLNSYSVPLVSTYTLGIMKFLKITKGLTNINIEDISDDFSTLNEGTKAVIVLSSLNLLDYFSDLEKYEEILSLLYELKKQYNIEKKVRILPSSRDILVFSRIVEDFFSKELTEKQYLRWFPIWFWWKVTNLIPMRPSEFCNISRDSLKELNGNYYIQLPRIKQKKVNSNRIQIVDKVYIPHDFYQKLEEYKQITEKFGFTDTFITYESIPLNSNNKYSKIDRTKFSYAILNYTLASFYEHIVFGEYHIQFNPNNSEETEFQYITRKLRLNDTRHLAFINMKRQGYHPVEIARMGGHTSIRSQEHYFNHIQNYVDLEILELITNTDLDSYSNLIKDKSISLGMDFINKYVLRPTNTGFQRIMTEGYCTDKEQRCMDEDCWGCDHWRISMEEFIQKQHILEQKMKERKSYLNETIDNLKKLYKAIYENIGKDEYYTSENVEIKKQLINHSKYIEKAVHKYINLYKVKERIDNSGDKGSKTKNLPTGRN